MNDAQQQKLNNLNISREKNKQIRAGTAMPHLLVEKRSAVFQTADKMSNVTNFLRMQ